MESTNFFFGYLALKNTYTAVGYFKNYGFKK